MPGQGAGSKLFLFPAIRQAPGSQPRRFHPETRDHAALMVQMRIFGGERTLKQTIEQIELPVFNLWLKPSECRFDSVEKIAEFLKRQIESHKAAHYIATFDHLEHTRRLPEGQVADEIKAAVNVVFCFGFSLQDPLQLATRPRSIGICRDRGGFTISFVEAPMPLVNALMEGWALALRQGTETAPCS